MRMKYLKWFGAIAGVFLALWSVEPWVIHGLSATGKPAGWLHPWIAELHHRLHAAGNANLADLVPQVKFRWLLVAVLALYLLRYASFQVEDRVVDHKKMLWPLRLFIVFQLLYLPDLSKELALRFQWRSFYEPSGLPGLLVPAFPETYVIQWVVLAMFAVGAVLVVARLPLGSGWFAGGLLVIIAGWTFLLSLLFGFGKTDHTYASMYSGLWGMAACCTIWYLWPGNERFGLRLFQAFIWACYFFSGLEKLVFSGWSWVASSHFDRLAFLHPTPASNWIAGHPTIASIILAAAMLFQLATALQWRWPWWGFVTIAGGLAFHLGTWLIFGIGGWQSPWLLMLFFLWPNLYKDASVLRRIETKKPSN